MKTKAIFDAVKAVGTKHGATALTVLAALGVVATAYLTNKARPDADERVQRAREDKAIKEAEEKRENPDFNHVELTTVEKIKAAAPAYVKVFVVAGLTIIFIVGSRVISIRQMGDLAAAYNIIQTVEEKTVKYGEKYEEKVKEIIGDEKNAEVKKAVREEMFDTTASTIDKDDMAGIENVILGAYHTGEGTQLIYDELIGRWFYSDTSMILEQAANLNLSTVGSYNKVSLNDFYDAISAPEIAVGDMLYWCVEDRYSKVMPVFSSPRRLLNDKYAYVVMTFEREPEAERR